MTAQQGVRFKFRRSRSGMPGMYDVFAITPGTSEEMALGVLQRNRFTRGWHVASLTIADPGSRRQMARLPLGKPFGNREAGATWMFNKVRRAQ